jgi:hypothetical protein
MTSLVNLEKDIESMDLTKLSTFVAKLNTIHEAYDKNLAPTMMRNFILAQDVTTVMLAKATQVEMLAKSAVDTAEAIALLDKADAYFEAKGQKPTADLRKAYITLDPEVVQAKDIHAKATAILVLLKNRVYEFKSAFEAVKQISRDSRQTEWEGM